MPSEKRTPAPEELYACPACGYRMFGDPCGTYEICSVCDWEDDAPQRIYPFCAVGANHVSLYDWQQGVRKREAAGDLNPGGHVRDPDWRWLTEADRAFFTDGAPRTGPEYFHAIPQAGSNVEYEYWRRRARAE